MDRQRTYSSLILFLTNVIFLLSKLLLFRGKLIKCPSCFNSNVLVFHSALSLGKSAQTFRSLSVPGFSRLLSHVRCEYVGEGIGLGSLLMGRKSPELWAWCPLLHLSSHLLCGLLAFLAEIWAGITESGVFWDWLESGRLPCSLSIVSFSLVCREPSESLSHFGNRGWVSLGGFSTPSLCWGTMSFLSRLAYWLAAQLLSFPTRLGNDESLSPRPTTVVPTGHQEVLRKATLQGLSLPNCLQMGHPERSCLSRALNRNRIRILHSSGSRLPTKYSLRCTSDRFALSLQFLLPIPGLRVGRCPPPPPCHIFTSLWRPL